MTNKEIADSLTMSARTVEGHIYRACNKLGLSSRAELAELLDEIAQ
jgi:DNA-binding CsgD family transcriptional regulator